MKVRRKVIEEVECKFIHITVPVYEDDVAKDLPFLTPTLMWSIMVEVDTGLIRGWPQGRSEHVFTKVCDRGHYVFLDDKMNTLIGLKGVYVPHCIVPGQYGDYIDLNINEDGVITNWPKKPNLDNIMSIMDDDYYPL